MATLTAAAAGRSPSLPVATVIAQQSCCVAAMSAHSAGLYSGQHLRKSTPFL